MAEPGGAAGPAHLDPPVPAARGAVGKATAIWDTPDGKIRYYANTGTFTAACAAHNCIITRSAKSSKKKSKNSGQQRIIRRPVGFLAAWLDAGLKADVTSKEGHLPMDLQLRLSLDWRVGQRALAKADPTGSTILAYEREILDGEQSEPESVGAYVHERLGVEKHHHTHAHTHTT